MSDIGCTRLFPRQHPDRLTQISTHLPQAAQLVEPEAQVHADEHGYVEHVFLLVPLPERLSRKVLFVEPV